MVGLDGVRVDVAMLETADGRRLAFEVDDIDASVAGLGARDAKLLGDVERYEDSYRLCYVRGLEGIIITRRR